MCVFQVDTLIHFTISPLYLHYKQLHVCGISVCRLLPKKSGLMLTQAINRERAGVSNRELNMQGSMLEGLGTEGAFSDTVDQV
jgi:hypothetical protein